MTNQKYKVRPQIFNVNCDEPILYNLVLKQGNALVDVTISMIHMQSYVFLMLQKILNVKVSGVVGKN